MDNVHIMQKLGYFNAQNLFPDILFIRISSRLYSKEWQE